MSKALEDIAAERNRQVVEEGWAVSHDDEHADGELAEAAACYCMSHRDSEYSPPAWWPWSASWWKPKGRRRDLVRAAALIVAEIERLDRLHT